MTTSNLSGPHDLLLAWLSARPEPSLSTTTLTLNCRRLAESTGMLAQAQGAEKLSQSHWRYQLFDPLYRLGHVEQIAQDRWMLISPTAIRTVTNENQSVLRLYGARSTSLWQQLHTVCQTCGATLSQTGQDNGPTRWQIEMATDDVLAALEQALSVVVYPDRSDELLASLPTLAQAIAHLEPCQFPQHGQWEQFCPASQLHWQPIQLRQPLPEGLYRPREQSNYACFIFERHPDGKGTTAVLLDQPELNYVARWYEIGKSKCGKLHYQVRSSQLYIRLPRGGWPLPLLLDRPLRLASGLCPTVEWRDSQYYLCYSEISKYKARQVARILALKLETHDE